MSWLFSQALVEEYSEDISSDGELSAQLSGNPTQLAYLPPDRMTAFSRLSRFGMTFKPLTESLGEDVLTSFLADFPVRTFLPLERAQESTGSGQECGSTWRELLARYDPYMSMWKTAQCSLLEDSTEFLGTWPRWGLMQDGASYQQQTLVRHTKEIGSGSWLMPTPTTNPEAPNHGSNSKGPHNLKEVALTGWKPGMMWPTPVHSEARQGLQIRREGKKGTQQSLTTAVLTWPTPRSCSAMAARLTDQGNRFPNLETVMAHSDPTTVGGQLNPTWVEWLMGWPLGWTDLKPLGTDKFLLWQQQHSDF